MSVIFVSETLYNCEDTKGALMQKQTMTHYFLFLIASILALPAMAASTLPSDISLKYQVIKNDIPFANIKEHFQVTGDTYAASSVAKGVGVFALFGERKLSSQGLVTKQGLKPQHFELHQGDKASKTLITDFDWKKNQLNMQIKGNVQTVALKPGTQDLVSYAYQFMYAPAALKTPFSVDLTTGKKLKNYPYKVEPETLNIDGKDIETIHLVPVKKDPSGKDTKEFWLAKAYHYLPVHIVVIDKRGQKLEQTLIEFNAK